MLSDIWTFASWRSSIFVQNNESNASYHLEPWFFGVYLEALCIHHWRPAPMSLWPNWPRSCKSLVLETLSCNISSGFFSTIVLIIKCSCVTGRSSELTLEQSSLPGLVSQGLARLGNASSSHAGWRLRARNDVIRLSASHWHTYRQVI